MVFLARFVDKFLFVLYFFCLLLFFEMLTVSLFGHTLYSKSSTRNGHWLELKRRVVRNSSGFAPLLERWRGSAAKGTKVASTYCI